MKDAHSDLREAHSDLKDRVDFHSKAATASEKEFHFELNGSLKSLGENFTLERTTMRKWGPGFQIEFKFKELKPFPWNCQNCQGQDKCVDFIKIVSVKEKPHQTYTQVKYCGKTPYLTLTFYQLTNANDGLKSKVIRFQMTQAQAEEIMELKAGPEWVSCKYAGKEDYFWYSYNRDANTFSSEITEFTITTINSEYAEIHDLIIKELNEN